MTKVMPMAMIPLMEFWLNTFSRLPGVINRVSRTEAMISMTTRIGTTVLLVRNFAHLFVFILSPYLSLSRRDIQIDREQDNDALRHVLSIGRKTQQHKSCFQNADDQGADKGPEDAAASSCQAGPAQNDRGNHIELVSHTHGALSAAAPGGKNDTAYGC